MKLNQYNNQSPESKEQLDPVEKMAQKIFEVAKQGMKVYLHSLLNEDGALLKKKLFLLGLEDDFESLMSTIEQDIDRLDDIEFKFSIPEEHNHGDGLNVIGYYESDSKELSLSPVIEGEKYSSHYFENNKDFFYAVIYHELYHSTGLNRYYGNEQYIHNLLDIDKGRESLNNYNNLSLELLLKYRRRKEMKESQDLGQNFDTRYHQSVFLDRLFELKGEMFEMRVAAFSEYFSNYLEIGAFVKEIEIFFQKNGIQLTPDSLEAIISNFKKGETDLDGVEIPGALIWPIIFFDGQEDVFIELMHGLVDSGSNNDIITSDLV